MDNTIFLTSPSLGSASNIEFISGFASVSATFFCFFGVFGGGYFIAGDDELTL
jgi:hypothetical protein